MNTLELILAIISTIATSGIIGLLIFYRSKRRTAAAEATTAEVNAQGGLLAQYETMLDSCNQENKALKEEIRIERADAREARKREAEERERVVNAYKERADALVELEIMRGRSALAEYNKCEAVRCNRRTPPRTELPTNQ